MILSGNMLIQQSDLLSNFFGSFKELRAAGELLDVTLACEDQTVEAHKVVVSACSPFFRQVLTKTKQNHPFIYLKGVLHKDLVAILDFIYNGETQVPAEDVNRFIEAAEELKIKGLSDDGLESIEEILINSDELQNKENMKSANELESIEEILFNSDELENKDKSENGFESIEEIRFNSVEFENNEKSANDLSNCINETMGEIICSSEEFNVSEINITMAEKLCSFCDKGFKTKKCLTKHINRIHEDKVKQEKVDVTVDEKEQNEKLQTEISMRIEKVMDLEQGDMWKCKVCGKLMKKKDKISYHVEIHLEGFSHRCLHCDKPHKTRGSLSAHTSAYHRSDK